MDDRKFQADREIERALLRDKSDLTDAALIFLRDEARKTLQYQDYLNGMSLDVREVVASVKHSDVGQMIYAPRDDTGSVVVDHQKAIAALDASEKMNYARKYGLM
jgi:hypothetical protein